MRITCLLIMMIVSLGIVCQAYAATRCAPDYVADGGASVAGMNAVGESVSLPDHIRLHSDHISFNSDTESYRAYSGGYTYLNGTLERVETPVGYIHSSGVHLAYLKDYQGNVRAVVADGMAVELDDYYPYGMSMCIPWGDSAFQSLKYGSKELDRANGWDNLDYGMMGIPFINTGIDHGSKTILSNPTTLPSFR